MRKIFLVAMVFTSFSGAMRSYGSDIHDIVAIASKGDETWFLTDGDGAVVFNKKSYRWNKKTAEHVSFKMWNRFHRKELHGYFINLDANGYWYYSDGKILNLDINYNLKKEYCLTNDCKNFDVSNGFLYDDGDFIWAVFSAEPNKIYGINKSTGNKYAYRCHNSFFESAKEVGKGIAAVFLMPFLLLKGGIHE